MSRLPTPEEIGMLPRTITAIHDTALKVDDPKTPKSILQVHVAEDRAAQIMHFIQHAPDHIRALQTEIDELRDALSKRVASDQALPPSLLATPGQGDTATQLIREMFNNIEALQAQVGSLNRQLGRHEATELAPVKLAEAIIGTDEGQNNG